MPQHHGKFVAYYRCSTERQGRSGLGLEAQQEAVRAYLNGGNWQLVAEVVEVESGKRSDRPKLAEALKLCRLHKATLIIAKLDGWPATSPLCPTSWRAGLTSWPWISRRPTGSRSTFWPLWRNTRRRRFLNAPRTP
jgi:hypothetical protein